MDTKLDTLHFHESLRIALPLGVSVVSFAGLALATSRNGNWRGWGIMLLGTTGVLGAVVAGAQIYSDLIEEKADIARERAKRAQTAVAGMGWRR